MQVHTLTQNPQLTQSSGWYFKYSGGEQSVNKKKLGVDKAGELYECHEEQTKYRKFLIKVVTRKDIVEKLLQRMEATKDLAFMNLMPITTVYSFYAGAAQTLYISMPYYWYGNLRTFIETRDSPFSQQYITDAGQHLFRLLDYLHSHNITSNSVSTENMMVHSGRYTSLVVFDHTVLDMDRKESQTDVWYAGVVLYEIMTRTKPSHMSLMNEKSSTRIRSELQVSITVSTSNMKETHYSTSLIELVISMLEVDPKKQPSIAGSKQFFEDPPKMKDPMIDMACCRRLRRRILYTLAFIVVLFFGIYLYNINTVYFNDGEYFVGDIVGDEPHGKGVYYWPHGERYEGDFVNGYFEGTGKIYMNDTLVFEGDFKNGNRHGHGTVYIDSDLFIGAFIDGKLHGSGVFYFDSGEKVEAEFRRDRIDALAAVTKDGKLLQVDLHKQFPKWKSNDFHFAERRAILDVR